MDFITTQSKMEASSAENRASLWFDEGKNKKPNFIKAPPVLHTSSTARHSVLSWHHGSLE